MKNTIKYRNLISSEEPSPNKHRTLLLIDSLGGVPTFTQKYNEVVNHIDKLLNLSQNEDASTRALFYDYCSSLIFNEIYSINKVSNFSGLRCMFVDEYVSYIKELKALSEQSHLSDDFNNFINRIIKYGYHTIQETEHQKAHQELCDYVTELELLKESDIQKIWDDYNSPLSDVYNQLESCDLRISDLKETANITLWWAEKIKNEFTLTEDEAKFKLSEALINVIRNLMDQYPIKKGRNPNGKIQASIIESLHHAKIIDLSRTPLLRVIDYLQPKIATLGSYKVISEHFGITHNPNEEFVKTLTKAAF